jgi:protease-4
MGSESRPMTPQERAILQKMVDDIYGQFVDRVAEGRRMQRDKVLLLADGRVFTGRQAKNIGLVDELGDFRDAVREAGQLAGIKGEPEVTDLGPTNLWDVFFRNITGRSLYSTEMLPAWLICLPISQR